MKSKFAIKGTRKLGQALKKLGPRVLEVAGGSLYESFEEVMAESKERYVPIDTGALKSTGLVELPTYGKTSVQVRMGYGGPAAPYAVYVHEIDKNYRNGRTWKYLETPLKQSLPKIESQLVRDINDAARSFK